MFWSVLECTSGLEHECDPFACQDKQQ